MALIHIHYLLEIIRPLSWMPRCLRISQEAIMGNSWFSLELESQDIFDLNTCLGQGKTLTYL